MHAQPFQPMKCLAVLAVVTGLLVVSRSAPAQDAAQTKPDGLAAFEALVYSDGQGGELPYRLIVPEQAEGPSPVLLFLHGAGERGDDLGNGRGRGDAELWESKH